VRNTPWRTAVAVLALTCALLASVSDSVYDKQQQLQGLNGQIITAKTQIKQLLDQENAIKAQMSAIDSQLKTIAQQIEQETAKLARIAAQIEQAKLDLAAKEAQLAQHIEEFGKRMRFMYKSGQVSGLELILSAANFTDLMNRVFFFNDIVQDDRRQVEAQLRADDRRGPVGATEVTRLDGHRVADGQESPQGTPDLPGLADAGRGQMRVEVDPGVAPACSTRSRRGGRDRSRPVPWVRS